MASNRAEQAAVLASVIEASGMTIRSWAEIVAWRDERTVRRWLDLDSPIPDVVWNHVYALAARLPQPTE